MTDREIKKIINEVWDDNLSLNSNLKALVHFSVCYGWRLRQVANWIEKYKN